MKLKDFILKNYKKYDNRTDFINDAVSICNVKRKTVYNRLSELKIIFKNDNKIYKKQTIEIDPHSDIIEFYKNKILNQILKKFGWVTEKELKIKLKITKYDNYIWYNIKKEINEFKIELDKNIHIYVFPSLKKEILKIKKELEKTYE